MLDIYGRITYYMDYTYAPRAFYEFSGFKNEKVWGEEKKERGEKELHYY